jgi:hypothetical protein
MSHDTAETPRRRRRREPGRDPQSGHRWLDRIPRTVRSVVGGLGATVAILVLVFIPIIVRLRLPPVDVPLPLSDGPGLLLYVIVGVVVGLLLQYLRRRPLAAGIAAVLVLLLAVWLQRGMWWIVDGVPTPPTELLLLRLAFVPVAGILLGTLVIALVGGKSRRASADAAGALAGTSMAWSVVAGVVTAASVVAVTETAVWGSNVLQTTFQGPWGLSRPSWLRLAFAATLIASGLVGWLASSLVRRPVAPAVVAMLVLLAAVWMWLGDGLAGEPRILVYGLAIGVPAVAALAPYRPRRRQAEPRARG